MDSSHVNIFVAFGAGLASFLSPCVLPLIPSYAAFITGLSLNELRDTNKSGDVLRKMILNSLFFILGFSAVFISLGASASFIGKILSDYKDIITKIGGAVIIILGLFMTGLIKLNFLSQEKKFHVTKKPLGFLGAFVVGVTFAAGWTPCVGPILGSVLVIASSSSRLSEGILLLAVYSLGLALPFFASTIALGWFLNVNKKISKYINIISIAAGILIIIIGLFMVTGKLSTITYWLSF